MRKINLAEKFSLFHEHWRPKIIDEANAYDFKLVRIKGAFLFHSHNDADETFLCWRGAMRVETHDAIFHLNEGEMVTVPAGVEHRTAADEEALVMIIAPKGLKNTGDKDDPRLTAPIGERI
ncbi:MAG: cupin domain-containing protein [Parvularculaceae bacterium]